ncbi:MAG: hypothetical protein GY724_11895 [Actinomycetia bacterium]|nr:hypothetical protein [Actinomycetes bacterium]MCP4223422.1 hypothetical protein [Actinomycetes bacterium]MCP5033533.1 hypothetical protein [Actinomycetes bacterium]
MSSLYDRAAVPVRQDLDTAHFETAQEWASPGNWWSATERLAMVNEVRRARAADELPPWVAPTTVDGLIDDDHVLPKAAIDAVWRLTNHSGTLTREWYDEIIERGLTPEQYVELVAVVATANCIEVFGQAVGAEPIALPSPAEGRPDRELVAGAEPDTHWVPTTPDSGANVSKALSAVPVAARAWRRLSDVQYLPFEALLGDLTWSRGALDRTQVELLAARTSLLNECFY